MSAGFSADRSWWRTAPNVGSKTSGRFLKRKLLPEVVGAQPDHDSTFQAKPVSPSCDRRTRERPMITGRLAARSASTPFSDAVIAGGRLAFLAGQGPSLNGTVVGGWIAEQTRVTMQNLAGILEQLGADKKSAVVSCTCYLADPADVARTAAAPVGAGRRATLVAGDEPGP